MAPKSVVPSIKVVSFNCPHCGALSHQNWHDVQAKRSEKGELPKVWTPKEAEDRLKEIKSKGELDSEALASLGKHFEKLASGFPFMDWTQDSQYGYWNVSNAFISRCYSCSKVSFWIYDRLIWPAESDGPAANNDLPDNIKADYEEASKILKLSPRGAAALLRLCIQKICIFLGEPGKYLDKDIGNLVQKKGLSVHIQQALDVVRVVGNNAVHPGHIDLNDNREIALSLFNLVNLLADTLITAPKQISDMFEKLVPEGTKEAIAKRDKKPS